MAKVKNQEFRELMELYKAMRAAQCALSNVLTNDRNIALAVCPDPIMVIKQWDEVATRCLEVSAPTF